MKNWQPNIKNYLLSKFNWRIAIAFALGLVVSALLMDFDIFADILRSHSFTLGFSNFLALVTGGIIKVFGYEVSIIENTIRFSSTNGVYFDFGCLGYREIIWFSLFILVAPGPKNHKLWYIPVGIIIIELSNILRAASIAITNFHSPQSFEIIHAQGTVWFVYGTLLALWIIWLHYFENRQTGT
jgi:exosortase/archaeosortase family protein